MHPGSRRLRISTGTGLALFVLSLLAFVFAMPNSAFAKSDKGKSNSYDKSRVVDRYSSDIRYLKRISDEDVMATEITRAADTDRTRRQLRDYCDNLERRVHRDIDRTHDQLKDQYDVRYNPQIEPGAQQYIRRLQNVDKRDEYEIRLLKLLIDYHQTMIDISRRATSTLIADNTRRLAAQTIDVSSADKRQLQIWLKDWYDISYGGVKGPGGPARSYYDHREPNYRIYNW